MNILKLSLYFLLSIIYCQRLSKFHKLKRKKRNLTKNSKMNNRKLAITFTPLNFSLDLSNYNKTFPHDILNEENSKDKIIESVIEAKTILEGLLELEIDLGNGLENITTDNRDEWGLEEWESDIYTKFKYEVNKYNYIVAFKFSDEIKNIASGRIVQEFQYMPCIGIITINPEKIKSKVNMPEFLKAYMLHQLIHLLGFHIYIEDDEGMSIFDSIIQESEEGEEKFYFLSEQYNEKVFEYTRNYFNCEELPEDFIIKLDLDEDGNVHWPKRYFLGEIMTEFDYPEEQVLSGFTLAFLEDTTYLRVVKNYTGGLMRFGKNKGCQFIEADKKCGDYLDQNNIIYGNEFYLPNFEESEVPSKEPSCSSGRLSKTVYKLHSITSTPDYYEYLINDYGGIKSTNYCPISAYDEENELDIYAGRCSNSGTSTDNMLENELGEKFSDTSFCVLSSLLKSDSTLDSKYRAVCYQMFCSLYSLTILIRDNYIVCPRAGGKITAENFKGYLLCPDYNLICTGTTLCNNLFECIEKKSEEKNNTFDYSDYTIKTTQNSKIYKTDDYISNVIDDKIWELDEGEKKTCPFMCMQCDINKKCIKCAPHYKKDEEDTKCVEIVPYCDAYNENEECTHCKENYFLVQDIKNNPFYCKEDTTDNRKNYYQFSTDPESYKKCDNDGIDNCEECTTNTACDQCKTGFEQIDDGTICGDLETKLYFKDTNNKYKSCYKYTENQKCKLCEMNEGNYLCIRCQDDSAFFLDEIDQNKCILKADKNIAKYFTTDEVTYKSCNDLNYHNIQNCETCDKIDECISCIGEYISVNDKKLCILLSEKLYYLDTDNYYKLCSTSLEHCKNCESKTQCITCNSDDYGLDENDKCLSKSLVNPQHYYYLDGEKLASCTKISKCEKCLSATECILCVNGYYLIEGDDNIISCKNIDITSYYEITTVTNKKYYRKCERDIDNCDTCSGSNSCITCKENYAIIEDDHTKCEDLTTEKYYYESSSGKYRLCSNKLDNC